ncbi:Transcription elongation factor spt6 [Elasticomyces elasticus]|nr:Transcription elongation factor spt6 [Elasticomyces elasticus]KAK3627192.1 Transcription elongation factor spt6 [Elasticomyces elasticus]KAK4928503.1 Transcription elongation factor spt6 [Elasticomyces elasticus]KAK5753611.1 Transcription elongation factor spt6 [Elasticomyces elasticus]
MDDFFDRTAAVGSDEEEEEEELNDETGEATTSKSRRPKTRNPDLADSSEEEEDDDEEEARRIREGFIVDEEDEEAVEERRQKRRKRRREEKEVEDENLDEDDLELIGVPTGVREGGEGGEREKQGKFKRLKRGHRVEERGGNEVRGVEDIFSDDEDAGGAVRQAGFNDYTGDDLGDFIEEDEFPDEEAGGLDEDLGVRAPNRAGYAELQNLKDSGLDERALEDMRGAFGEGDEFGWALSAEEDHDDTKQNPDQPLELKDVFEPSQLIEKMLTEEDNAIRMIDIPERYQLARKPYKDLSDLSEDEMMTRCAEESKWIATYMFPHKRNLAPSLRGPFEKAIEKVLYFMNWQNFEPPFIFQNRRDYLIHSEQIPASPDPSNPNAPAYTIRAEKLLTQDDLWTIVEHDLKFRTFDEKRDAIATSLETLKDVLPDFTDSVFDDMIPVAAQIDDLQDLQDYLNFQYSQQLRDHDAEVREVNGTQKRARGTRSVWDKVRAGPAYHFVRAMGITADGVAGNVSEKGGRRTYTEDSDTRPDDLADTLVQEPEFKTGSDVLVAGKAMWVEEFVMSPRVRRWVRKVYYEQLVFDVKRTEKGKRVIDEEHAYYAFKYLRNQGIKDLFEQPEMFLRMLKAEQEGLVEVVVRLPREKNVKSDLYRAVESDSFSEVADAWNGLRRECVDVALGKLHKLIARGVKDTVKNECENRVGGECRRVFGEKLDQAAYRPVGMVLGTVPRVLAMSSGRGDRGDAVCWAYMEETGRVLESGKFVELRLGNQEKFIEDGKDIAPFVELVERRKPDVIAVSGWSVETRNLYKDVKAIVESRNLMGAPYEDADEDRERQDPLDVVIVNDEVARLYQTSKRGEVEFPSMPPLTRYCVALARYMQDPLKEYASLGRGLVGISFDANQQLIPEEKLWRYLETSLVDMVNLVGVDVNEAVADVGYAGNLLQYVCGLGQRKAGQLVKVVNMNGGEVVSRADLVGDVDRQIRQAVSPVVWTNCASFVYVRYVDVEGEGPEADPLDNTRIHPEDYDLARKIAADALEMDEEDVKGEIDENGVSGVVKRLLKDDQADRVNDLVLEEYAEQLEKEFKDRKRATLETIREELQSAYEELRHNFGHLSSEQIFTQLTGETRESLQEGMIVPVSVKRTFNDHLEVTLDCGITGTVAESEYPEDVYQAQREAREVWTLHQVVRGKIKFLKRKELEVELTLREVELRKPFKRHVNDHDMEEWDDELEARDRKEARKAVDPASGRAQRVIKHPLFKPFNGAQAVEFLGPLGRGECVIRPSSKGPDHLAVTWKVFEGVFQHIDVLELDKENEFSVGRTLRIGGGGGGGKGWTYSDLDELIVLHVRAMARKVEEMMGDERYQAGSRQQTEQWLTTYTEANPRRSMYAFCLNPKYPGYFYLCFKAGQNAPLANWPVKVIPNAFELKGNKYPDMRALKNGFKVVIQHMGQGATANVPRR